MLAAPLQPLSLRMPSFAIWNFQENASLYTPRMFCNSLSLQVLQLSRSGTTEGWIRRRVAGGFRTGTDRADERLNANASIYSGRACCAEVERDR